MTITETTVSGVSSRVPPALVRDFDFDAFCNEGDDPFRAAARMLDGPPMVYVTGLHFGQPGWIVTRHALMEEVFLHPELFSSRLPKGAVGEDMDDDWKMIPFELDPPEHGKYRRILQPFFSPKGVRMKEQMVREVCDSLVAPLLERDDCEFIHDFASRLPNIVFLKMMGLPVDMLDQFLEWEGEILRSPDAARRTQASQTLMGYLMGFIAEQRKDPQTELMRIIFAAQVDGRPLSEKELLATCFLLYLGGLDTVYSSLGWIFRHLANDQALQQHLRDNPQDIPKAVEEFLRGYPVTRMMRTVTKDCIFHGVDLRKGDVVTLPIYIAGRDPQAYENPHAIDIDRKARKITFGTGPHTCLGVHLAKREIGMALEVFLSNFRNIRIPEGKNYEYHAGAVFGVDALPLVWDRI